MARRGQLGGIETSCFIITHRTVAVTEVPTRIVDITNDVDVGLVGHSDRNADFLYRVPTLLGTCNEGVGCFKFTASIGYCNCAINFTLSILNEAPISVTSVSDIKHIVYIGHTNVVNQVLTRNSKRLGILLERQRRRGNRDFRFTMFGNRDDVKLQVIVITNNTYNIIFLTGLKRIIRSEFIIQLDCVTRTIDDFRCRYIH